MQRFGRQYWFLRCTSRSLSVRGRKNPFLNAQKKEPVSPEPKKQAEPVPQQVKPPMYGTLHPQRFMADDLLDDDAADDLQGFDKPQERDRRAMESPQASHPAVMQELATLIERGDEEGAIAFVRQLCAASKRASAQPMEADQINFAANNAIEASKPTEEPLKTTDESKIEQTKHQEDDCDLPALGPSHPLFKQIQCLPMHTFYCLPDDTACEKAFHMELAEKKNEWASYRKTLTALVQSIIVNWYANAKDTVALVDPDAAEVVNALEQQRLAKKNAQSAPGAKRTFFDRRSAVASRRPSMPFKRVSSADPAASDLEINLVIKALRPEQAGTKDSLRFSVGVRGDSFPQKLSEKLTKGLNEATELRQCPISIAFDLYFCIAFDASAEDVKA